MSGRKYCLVCSPFGSRNTRQLDGSVDGRSAANSSRAHPKEVIQEANRLYQSGLSRELVAKQMSLSESTLSNWMIEGKITKRTHAESMKLACELGRMKGAAVWNEEHRETARQKMLARIAADPSCHPNRLCAGRMSYPERLVFDLLTTEGILFERAKRVCGFYPDFIIGKIIIEVDGARWHSPERDVPRDKILTDAGYTVHRFPAKLVTKDPRVVLGCLAPSLRPHSIDVTRMPVCR